MCTCEKVCKSYIKDTSLDSIKNRNKNDNTNIIITAEQNNIININITNQSNKSNKHINITNEDDKKTIKKSIKKLFKENNQSTMCVISKNNCSTTYSFLKDTTNSNNILQQNLEKNFISSNCEKIKESGTKKNSGFKKKNSKKNQDEDSDSEDTPNQEEEINLYINRNMESNLYSSTLSNTNDNINNNNNINNNDNKNNENTNFETNIFAFNLKSKKNMKYKFSGYIKKVNEKEPQPLLLKPNDSFNINTNSSPNNNKTKLIKEGYGKIIFQDGSLFISNFKDNKINGFGKYEGTTSKNNINNIDLDSNKKEFLLNSGLSSPKKRFSKRTITEEYIGEYINNKPCGFGIYTNFIENYLVVGNCGEKNWIGLSSNENYTYEGEFYNNKKNGIGTIIWNDGIKYQGQFLEDEMIGYGIIKYPGVGIYKGNVKNGRLDGFGEFQWDNGKKYVGFYKDDKREGLGIFIFGSKKSKNMSFNEDASAYIGFWKQGNLDGLGMKINEREVKYGVWENGSKKKWLEDTFSVKIYLKNMSKAYMKLFSRTKNKLLKLVNMCIDNKEDEFNL